MHRLCLMLCATGALSAAAYQAPSPEPTPEETEILELMNRFRADPAGEADRWGPDAQRSAPGGVDWNMFLTEMKALTPSPPLVFDLQALASARNHSFYMVHNGLGHDEKEGAAGFTGKSFMARMKAAGFKGGAGGENCFAMAPSPLGSHIGFIIDWGAGGPGGMQNGRGHRRNMHNPGFNVVGPGAVPNGSRLSVTHNFGRLKGRFAGGVVYTDANRNGRFDAGEGRGGIAVRTVDGNAQTTTWASGAYTLELPGDGPVALLAGEEGFGYQQEFPPGKDNVHFSWVVPPQADLDRADALLAALGDASGDPTEDKRLFRRLVDLHLQTDGLCLDPDRAARVATLVAPIAPDWRATREQVAQGLGSSDAKDFEKLLKEALKTYKGTLAETWLKEAGVLGEASQAVQNLEAVAKQQEVSRRDVQKLHDMLEKTSQQLTSGEFRSQMQALAGRVARYL